MRRCTRKMSWGGLFSFCAFSLRLFAASEVTETFDNDVSGWTSSSPAAPLSHVASDGSIRLTLIGFGVPDQNNYFLVAGSGASNGAFVGDYNAAGVNFISFDFMAEDVIPSNFTLRLEGSEGAYFFNFVNDIQGIGVWHRCMINISSQAAGGWVGSGVNGFESFLGDVTQLRFLFAKNGTATQRFRFDNIALERIPQATNVSITMSSEAVVRWAYLNPAVTYTVQAADSPLGTWSNIGSFMPLGNEYDFVDPASISLPRRVYRLLTP